MSIKLRTAKIKNFKSLGDIELNLRDLTIIVGANSSGKSNCLEALYFIAFILVKGKLPSTEAMPRFVRDSKDKISFEIVVEDDNNQAKYQVSLGLSDEKMAIASEHLLVNGKKVIDIVNGKGKVCDEDGENPQKYESDNEIAEELALKSAGKFGNKPFTKKIANYIREWEFYNINPEEMKKYSLVIEAMKLKQEGTDDIPSLDTKARKSEEILNYWATNNEEKFNQVSQELKECLKIELIHSKNNEGKFVKVLEEDGNQMPLFSMSDGTLRIIAYCVLLYQSEIPPLISIEEPERNLHPGILKDVASIIKRLSQRTQVIFTTHSSQLLDCFETEEVSSEISLILLSKKPNCGTKSFFLDKLAESREDLLDWMKDFGVGSAIYHSQLLQEILEN